MSNSHLPHARLIAALKNLSPDGDALMQLIALVDTVRPENADNTLLAHARFTTLCETVETDATVRHNLRTCLLGLFAGRKQVSFFADSGILPNSGFFSELWRRMVQRVFPAITDPNYLRDGINLIFHRRDDHVWLDGLPTDVKLRFWQALQMTEVRNDPALLESLAQMLDATDVLAARIGAMGLEPELIRLYPRIEERGSPFLALAVETHQLSAAYRAYLAGGEVPTEDEGQLQVLIEQCREVLVRVRARAAAVGTSLTLTYLIRRLDQSLRRLEIIIRMLSMRHQLDDTVSNDLPLVELWVEFLGQAIHGEGMRQGIRAHVASTIGLLALRVTDNASRAGEHYITTTRSEYFAMWRSAMWAGFVVGFMALLKVYSSKPDLAPLGYALAYAMNYSLGFMFIHVMHWTLATKQPAMTASTIAGVIGEIRGRMKDVEKLATLVTDLIRSQIAAILGNVLVAIPTAMLLAFIISQITGQPIMNAEKAHHMLRDLSPVDGLALLYAAMAGVCLFIGGLISGYYDNLAAYERIRERIEHTRWLRRLLGEARLARFARYMDDNLGALAGNFFLGIMLASASTIGVLTGLPVDVRHVTLSSAQFGLAVVSLNFAVEWIMVGKVLAGIALIGFLNLTVSFSLALWVALRARGVGFSQSGALVSMLFTRLRTNFRNFFWPQNGTSSKP
ncbi:MAG: site-specific recombinase [Betaproteobacteria bacterium]|nr:site-specific recombinase [Betaproteobacteria bacterium]